MSKTAITKNITGLDIKDFDEDIWINAFDLSDKDEDSIKKIRFHIGNSYKKQYISQ